MMFPKSKFSRRSVLAGSAAIAAGGLAYAAFGNRAPHFGANAGARKPLEMPALLDATQSGQFSLTARSGTTQLTRLGAANTIGFNGSYLGPVVRVQNGFLRPTVENTLTWPISTHWHGLLVPGRHDGGPHISIEAGSSWSPDMEINQEPCTAFFHTHIHRRTAQDVYSGLAGILHVVDGHDRERGLPQNYGVDDLTLVLQDRRFLPNGQLEYVNSMMDVMHGMTGDTMVINGQVGSIGLVPKSVVRLRLVNASNARTYKLYWSDRRPMHLVATDGGYLPSPLTLNTLQLGSGERAEVLVDFSNGRDVSLASDGDPNEGMGGMMGRARGMFDDLTGARRFEVLPFRVDERLPRDLDCVPDAIGGGEPAVDRQTISRTRHFTLDMGMGPGMMRRDRMGAFSINGRAFRMNRINERIKLGDAERWIVGTEMLAHPFHVHGVSFQVVRENGNSPRPEHSGWKDTVVIDGETELLMEFNQPASDDAPFMYHCHILEHEDGGMMGQFAVG